MIEEAEDFMKVKETSRGKCTEKPEMVGAVGGFPALWVQTTNSHADQDQT